MVARPANALWRRTVRGELTAAKAAVRMTVLAKAPVASVPLEQDLRGDDAPRSPTQSPGLRLPLPDAPDALGEVRRHRRYRFGQAAVHHGTHVGQFRVLSQTILGTGHECSALTRNTSQGGDLDLPSIVVARPVRELDLAEGILAEAFGAQRATRRGCL